MSDPIKILDNYQFKKFFLPHIGEQSLNNKNKIQIYRIEDYLRDIVIPVAPYRTTFNFFILITKGELTQSIENNEYKISEYELVNIKNGNATRTLSISDDIEGFYVLYENDLLIDILLRNNGLKFSLVNTHIILDKEKSEWVQRVLELAEEEIKSNEIVKMNISVALLQSVLLKIFQTNNNQKVEVSRKIDIVYKFQEMIQKYHIDHRNVLFYANMLHVSENYLYKCIKEVLNKSPKQCINEVSILHSQILLKDKTRDIAEIAFELKFESPSYFTRLFKKITGFLPSEYKRLGRL